jgi:hypothetical protein
MAHSAFGEFKLPWGPLSVNLKFYGQFKKSELGDFVPQFRPCSCKSGNGIFKGGHATFSCRIE